MERKQSRFQAVLAAIGLLMLILDSRRALEGASSGVELCIKTVIPSLFPFFVLSIMLTNALNGFNDHPSQARINFPGIPKGAASLVIPALLGGYPVGAKCVGNLYSRKQIDRKYAERLLAFCSNAGPSFLFGMVSRFFPERKMVWFLWAIHIFSAVLTAAVILLPEKGTGIVKHEKSVKAHAVILPAAKTMAVVCCWVVLFRMIIAFLDAWILWALPSWVSVFLIGLLELTNGCCELFLITNIRTRFVLCACILAFGGVCVLLQTTSVIHGLSVGWYIRGKLLQTVFSFLLSCAVVTDHGSLAFVLIPIIVIILRKTRKKCSNRRTVPV